MAKNRGIIVICQREHGGGFVCLWIESTMCGGRAGVPKRDWRGVDVSSLLCVSSELCHWRLFYPSKGILRWVNTAWPFVWNNSTVNLSQLFTNTCFRQHILRPSDRPTSGFGFVRLLLCNKVWVLAIGWMERAQQDGIINVNLKRYHIVLEE